MRDYELMVVLDSGLEDSAVEAVNTRVTNIVTQRGGTIQSIEPWGRRRLAYPIGRSRDGIYVLMRFQAEGTVTAEVERTLKLTESVMRHLLVRAEDVAAPAPPPAPAPVPAAAAQV